MTTTTENAPDAGQGAEGNDQHTYQGEPAMNDSTTIAPTTDIAALRSTIVELVAPEHEDQMIPCTRSGCDVYATGGSHIVLDPSLEVLHTTHAVRTDGWEVETAAVGNEPWASSGFIDDMSVPLTAARVEGFYAAWRSSQQLAQQLNDSEVTA